MKNITKRIIFSILILINCVTIFYFSNQVADDSSKQSSRVVEIISNIIPYIKNMEEPDKTILKEEILTPIVRKIAHFSIYAMLGIFTTNFVLTLENKKISKTIIFSLLFCFIYAVTDEIHQRFIPGRSGQIRDVLIDTSGALVGIVLTITVTTIIRRIKSRNNLERDMLENKN